MNMVGSASIAAALASAADTWLSETTMPNVASQVLANDLAFADCRKRRHFSTARILIWESSTSNSCANDVAIAAWTCDLSKELVFKVSEPLIVSVAWQQYDCE
jgi:hypothetical protein